VKKEFISGNDEELSFFAKELSETVKVKWVPRYCIHVHGWMCAFANIFESIIIKNEGIFNETKIIASVYNQSLMS
jgi:starch synthase